MPSLIRWQVATVCAAALLLGACDADRGVEVPATSQADCDSEVVALVDGLQVYVDGFGGVGALEYASGLDLPDEAMLQRAITRYEDRLTNLECPSRPTSERLWEELQRLRGDGAIADAVADALRRSMLGAPTDAPREIEVGPEDDLAGVAITAPPGSTLRLAAGEHRVDEPVLVAHALTIVGAGQRRTHLISTAEESAIVVLEQGELELAGLTVSHEREVSSAVMLVLSSVYVIRDVTIQGGRSSDDGAGGIGILVESSQSGPVALIETHAPRSQRLEGVTVTDNEGPGLVATGNAAPHVRGGEFRDNQVCGVCFLGISAGWLTDSVILGNGAGVVVSDRADPLVRDNEITHNHTDGIVVEGTGRGRFEDNLVSDNGERGITITDEASPTVSANRIADNAEVGVAVIGTAAPTFEGNDIVDNEIGVWIEQEAQPTFVGNEISGDGDVGIIVTGSARATLSDNVVRGHLFGIEIREDARVQLDGNLVEASEEVAILVRDRATATGSENRCEVELFEILLIDDGVNDLDGDGCREPELL